MAYRLQVEKRECESLAELPEIFHEATDLNPRFEMPVWTALAGHFFRNHPMSRFAKRPLAILGAFFLVLTAYSAPVLADDEPQLRLSATVNATVDQDELSLVFTAYAEANSAAAANEQLIASLNEAKAKLGKPAEVNISNGVLQIYPARTEANEPTVWRGRGELVLDSKNLPAISQAADELTDMLALSRVNFSLSDGARRSEQARLVEQAAQAFREKAQAATKAFGYDKYEIIQLEISDSGDVVSPRPVLMSRMNQSAAASKPSLDLEPSQESVSLTVMGLVALH